ncbi:MAG: hypothetical protein M5U28_56110 [Sandaracinaceae bacterium]|nr:hypothetical protein [Sandaracinaceae bacterium]
MPLLEGAGRYPELTASLDSLAGLTEDEAEASRLCRRSAEIAYRQLGDVDGAWSRLEPRMREGDADAGERSARARAQRAARRAARGALRGPRVERSRIRGGAGWTRPAPTRSSSAIRCAPSRPCCAPSPSISPITAASTRPTGSPSAPAPGRASGRSTRR